MTDNQLFRILLPLIRDGLRANGIADIAIKQQYQPTQQGTPSGPVVFLNKIGDYRYGFPQRKSVWDREAGQFVHTESVWMQTAFQVNVLAPQDPKQPDLLTASDLLNLVACILQSDTARHTLHSHQVGIYRVQDIRHTYFADDRDCFEASPSFDFILTHLRTRASRAPSVDAFETNIRCI
ncbi:hypothetical protein KQH49_06755 [Mycetohabitans sp. B5]|uniref:Uncharacterized protein n=1 Tax=Mycetohabitans endofungorum TaxID=417203 RepID=A0A2P5KA39_9BURK|nr:MULTISPECIES: hypothetical protein [Mycetohabitans]MCG1054669.1 hypothetical protein [Mycetohabitans sp. B5]PPB83586.1 hypothetical protein B0O95_107102 [Mycetohabitans endofungorum]